MEQSKQNLLVDHLDKNLEGEALQQAEGLIRDDQEAAKEWQNLQTAVEAIQETGVYDQVGAIRNQYKAQQSGNVKSGAIVRGMSKNVLRIAATVLILIGAAVAYKYTTVNPTSMYNDYYTSFDLGTTRGSDNTDAIEEAYRNKDWNAVIALSNGLILKSNKIFFLSGMANLELKNYTAAIGTFSFILESNKRTKATSFQDEAEYYLALAYLGDNQPANALPLLEKIKADNDHLYHDKVQKMSTDLKVLEYKSGK